MAQSSQSLRVILATNTELRHKAQRAAALAAFQVITDAGITVTEADIADTRGDIAAMTISASEIGLPPTRGETEAVIVGVAIGALTGF